MSSLPGGWQHERNIAARRGSEDVSTPNQFQQDYKSTLQRWVYIQHLYRNLSLTPAASINSLQKKGSKSRVHQSSRSKLAASTSIRRPKRASSPDTNQSPETDSPSSYQPSRTLTLANTNHALGILSLSLTFSVHDAVNRAADTEIRRRLDDEWQVARAFAEVVDL